MTIVNDMQTQLNPTEVASIAGVRTLDDIQAAMDAARRSDNSLSIAGGRHAMGGQQFGRGTILIDTLAFNQITDFNEEKGLVEVESGMQWAALIDELHQRQVGRSQPWAIRQKQTGVDAVTIGGSLAANMHGRGLNFPPFADDIESFKILDANGNLLPCDRNQNAELFSLAIGGYGLFGIVTHITLRLVPRQKIKRLVEVIAVRNLISRVDELIREGFLYGDCQYSINLNADAEFHPGVFSCYKPIDMDTPISDQQKTLSEDDWANLYKLARADKQKAFQVYSQYYLGTSGQAYWSDTHQLSNVFQGYQAAVDEEQGIEMITEVYVTRDALIPFLRAVRGDFVQHNVDITYGTIRFIQKDNDTFLAWATESLVCIVCNVHIPNSEAGVGKAQDDFRRIIDRAIEYGGRFYLTYHRWATREQLEICYPQFADFLELKKQYDTEERFQSEWYRHSKQLFA